VAHKSGARCVVCAMQFNQSHVISAIIRINDVCIF